MKYFPVNLDIRGKKALVVGAGRVALRKVKALMACGARVTVVGPSFCRGLARMKGVKRIRRPYRKIDLKDMCLVVSATDSRETNERVWKHASSKRIPVNVVDQPELCTFTVPAVVRRGDLVVTVSTGGGSPALAAKIRKDLEKRIAPAAARHLNLLKEMRPKVQALPLKAGERAGLLRKMAGDDIYRTVREKGVRAARALLRGIIEKAVE